MFIVLWLILPLALQATAEQAISNLVNGQELPRFWPTKKLDGHVDSVTYDTRDGTFYVLVNASILKLDNNLNLLSYSTSLSLGSPNHNAINKLLFILKYKSNEFILTCWQFRDLQLNCFLHRPSSLGEVIPLGWPESVNYRLDKIDHIIAINSNQNFFIASSRLTLLDQDNISEQSEFLPALGRYDITEVNHAKKDLILEHRESVLTYKYHDGKHRYLYNHLYTFNYEQMTYFVLNDIRIYDSEEESPRLARVCYNDSVLTSYTEISINCDDSKVVYANFDPVEQQLLVVGEKRDEKKRRFEKSILCLYSMDNIGDTFNLAIKGCFAGDAKSKLLDKFAYSNSTSCVLSESEDYCTSRFNPHIDGTAEKPPNPDHQIDLGEIDNINFVHPIEQVGEKVYYIGTSSGILAKVNHGDERFFLFDINQGRLVDSVPTRQSNQFAKYLVSLNDIVAIDSRGVINKFDTDACYYYSSCRECLRPSGSPDPSNCVWCGDFCSNRQACRSPTTSCKPIIKSFYPQSGPLTGQTKLTIIGENFGTLGAKSFGLSVGGNNCSSEAISRNETMIECILKPEIKAKNASIEVWVDDNSQSLKFEGYNQSMKPFTFTEVYVYGLQPASGSVNHRNNLTIKGENLRVGLNQSVLLGNRVCEILSHSPTTIQCSLSPPSQHITLPESQPLKLSYLIDGKVQPIKKSSNLYEHFEFTGEARAEPLEQKSVLSLLPIALLVFAPISLILLLLKKETVVIIWRKIIYESDETEEVNRGLPETRNDIVMQPNGNPLSKRVGSIDTVSTGTFGPVIPTDQARPLMEGYMDGVNDLSETIEILRRENILINQRDLTLGHVLGAGQFGSVRKGFLMTDSGKEMIVAVKTLHGKSSWYDCPDRRAFLSEGLMMKDFDHENVLALVGVAFDMKNLPMVVTPFMTYGDLRTYITDETLPPSVRTLIDFGVQVARGMAYLAGQKFVHRDLATRNCMVDDNLVVKVADFGLSKDIYEKDYYSGDNQKKLPVKWMAIESLERAVYNYKTDVWSYGVLLWELMTRGVTPYPDVDNFDIFRYLKEGRRMLRPSFCPILLYDIMKSCWDEDPTKRPTFDQLVVQVRGVIERLQATKQGEQLVKYDRDDIYCDALRET